MELLNLAITIIPDTGERNPQVQITEIQKKYRNIVTVILATLGIGIVILYTICDTSCTYLEGDLLGLDLKYTGIGFMLAIIVLAVMKNTEYIRILLASGIGVEVDLIAFQFREEIFCTYCLAFAATVIVAFILNYEKPRAAHGDGSLPNKILYIFGDAGIPLTGTKRVPLSAFVLAGYVFSILTFSGSVTPAYGAENNPVPSYGSGRYEMIIFTDYFCGPCQRLESDIDPALEEFLSRGGVKVTFVDLPIHTETYLYARYFLYAAKAGQGFRSALHARRVLFSLAANRAAPDEDALRKCLSEQRVKFTPYNLKPVYHALNKIIRTYKVSSTPTCIIKYSSTDIRRYSGTSEIQNGLSMLRATLGAAGR